MPSKNVPMSDAEMISISLCLLIPVLCSIALYFSSTERKKKIVNFCKWGFVSDHIIAKCMRGIFGIAMVVYTLMNICKLLALR